MLHKAFINFVKQKSLLLRQNYRYHSLITKKGFAFSSSLQLSRKQIFKLSLLYSPKATLSSFKDDFNEESNNQVTILK